MQLVLASTSPRRRDLLVSIGAVPDRLAAPEIDESPRADERPRVYVERMAVEKARAVERAEGEIVLAGDTSIALGRRILGKPEDEADLRRMLGLLSGRRHRCFSALCVVDAQGRERVRVSETVVAFKRLSDADIDWYVASGEGMGKAGGYAIQSRAAVFVRMLSGSPSGVIGLPLYETRALLEASGYRLG
ncbi:MAG: septum formation protein Maf [Sphingomonas sp.]|nr:septum formation protein Maf [Sphingomonas sp.]